MLLPRSIAATVDSVARKAVGKDWSLYATLLNHWREIVGEDYAEAASPVKISFPQGKPAEEKWAQGRRTDGVLTVRIPQGLAMEFAFLTDQIRQRITSFFGYEAIARIAFDTYYGPAGKPEKPGPSPSGQPPAWLTREMEEIENGELREALENFGKAIVQEKEGCAKPGE